MERMYMSVRDAARATGLSEYCIRNKIKANEIPYIKSGIKYLVNISALRDSSDNQIMRMDSSDRPGPIKLDMKELIMSKAKTPEEGEAAYKRWETFAALKLIEQLYKDKLISEKVYKSIILENAEAKDLWKFTGSLMHNGKRNGKRR